MKTRILLIIALLSTSLHTFGQMVGDIKDFNDFKERPLVVVLPEVPGSNNGKAEIGRINELFKAQIKHFWTFNKDITFMTAGEVKDLKKQKKKDIKKQAVLEFTVWEVRRTTSSGLSNVDYNSTLSVSLLEDIVKNHYIYLHHFAPVFPSNAELVSAMLQIQNIMSQSMKTGKALSYPKESKANAGKLKDVTLLLDENLLNENVTEEEIKKEYGLSYKIVSTKEVEEAILNRTQGYAYVFILPYSLYSNGLKAQIVLNAQNGEVLGHSFPQRLRVGNHAGDKIGERNFKDYVQFAKK